MCDAIKQYLLAKPVYDDTLLLQDYNIMLAGWFPQITVDDTMYLQHVLIFRDDGRITII